MLKLKYILVFALACGFLIPEIQAQDITPPERPMITHVTVDTLTENTIIYWDESESTDVLWYYIYYEVLTVNGLEGVKLDSVAPGNSSYIHAGNAGEQALTYSISAIDNSGNESPRTPGFHRTIHTEIEYDSCSNAIVLRWTPYVGWGEDLSGYRIYSRQQGDTYGTPVGVSDEDTVFRFENIQVNTRYYFYVEALKNDMLQSNSAIEAKYTYMPGPPADFRIQSVDAVAETLVRINFEFTDTSGIDDFALLRSIDKNADFITVATKNDLENHENFFTDSIITGRESYYYKIGALNSCGQVMSQTNLGKNIVLQGENSGNDNSLNWNFYETWENGVEEYQVLIYNDDGSAEIIYTANPGVDSYIHNIQNIYGTGFEGLIRYRVIAKKTGENVYSQSNFIEIDISSNITVPNGFTPNSDGINDYFVPFFTVQPKNFLMVIYDRYGIVVYKTENPEEGWNGEINSGGMATEGVYTYHMQFTSHSGSSVEKTGNVTVFYP